MQSTLKKNGQQIIPGTEEYVPEPETKEKQNRRGNSLMRGLTREMWTNPYLLEGPEPIMSDSQCLEKGDKLLLSAIAFETEDEWLEYCRKVYAWREDRPRRELDQIAEKQASEYRDNPLLLELVLEKVKGENVPEAEVKPAPASKK